MDSVVLRSQPDDAKVVLDDLLVGNLSALCHSVPRFSHKDLVIGCFACHMWSEMHPSETLQRRVGLTREAQQISLALQDWLKHLPSCRLNGYLMRGCARVGMHCHCVCREYCSFPPPFSGHSHPLHFPLITSFSSIFLVSS